MPNRTLGEGCAILSEPSVNHVVRKRRGTVLFDLPFAPMEVGLHEHDVNAEKQTLCNRHLMETPEPDIEGKEWGFFKRRMRWLSRQIGFCRVAAMSTMLKGRNGRRRNRFWLGIQRYLLNGISMKDTRLQEMQKLEFYDVEKIEGKEDRGIQFRSVQYNAALARQIHNVERRLIAIHPYGYHPVMKCCTPTERAHRLFAGASKFKDPVFVCGDHCRFDAHFNRHIKKEERRFFCRCCGYRTEAVFLLKAQEKNIGYTEGGICYKCAWKRSSGDINTGCGNTAVNIGMVYALMDFLEFDPSEYEVGLDGDDFYYIIERSELHRMDGAAAFFLKLGFVTELQVARDIWQVEFCQSRPVLLPGGLTYVRNPLKVMATLGRSPESLITSEIVNTVRASAMCELAMAPGAPVIGPIASRVLMTLGKGRTRFSASMQWKADERGLVIDQNREYPDPDFLARYSMYRSWDIDPGQQLAYEEQPIIWDFDMKFKESKVKVVGEVAYDLFDLGDLEPECDCGDCPTYSWAADEAISWL